MTCWVYGHTYVFLAYETLYWCFWLYYTRLGGVFAVVDESKTRQRIHPSHNAHAALGNLVSV